MGLIGDRIILKDMGDHYEVFPDGDKLEKSNMLKSALEERGRAAKLDQGEWILTDLPEDLQHMIDAEVKRYDPGQRPVEQKMERLADGIKKTINDIFSD